MVFSPFFSKRKSPARRCAELRLNDLFSFYRGVFEKSIQRVSPPIDGLWKIEMKMYWNVSVPLRGISSID